MEDHAELKRVRSVRDEKSRTHDAPFGKGVRDVFDKILAIASRDEFMHVDFDGYALHIEHGSGDEFIGILAHLDIVPEGNLSEWLFNPFVLTNHNNHLYGRGVNDDKAPVLAAYYALKILRDIGLPFYRKVRIILGGAEETTWECMEHYFKYNVQPDMAFSPDGDFPIVNGEKGVMQGYYHWENRAEITGVFAHELLKIESEKQRGFVCEHIKVIFQSSEPEKLLSVLILAEEVHVKGNCVIAVYKGDKLLSRNPHKGTNAIFKFAQDLIHIAADTKHAETLNNLIANYLINDTHGLKLGLFGEDEEMGLTTFAIPYLLYNGTEFEIGYDYRYPKTISETEARNNVKDFARQQHMDCTIVKEHNTLYHEPDSALIRTLKHAYRNVEGYEPNCITKGGISYARAADNCVAFGPTFENDVPNTHKPNEKIRLETLYKAIIIYCETIRLLVSK